jgi:hypothetical protein
VRRLGPLIDPVQSRSLDAYQKLAVPKFEIWKLASSVGCLAPVDLSDPGIHFNPQGPQRCSIDNEARTRLTMQVIYQAPFRFAFELIPESEHD